MKKLVISMLAVSALALTSCGEHDHDLDNVKKVNKEVERIVGQLNDLKEANVDNLSPLGKGSKTDLTAWKKELADNEKLTNDAEEGKAGKMMRGEKTMYLSDKGVETDQLIKKGLIGAYQLNGFNGAIMKGIGATTAEARENALDEGVAYLLGDYSKAKSKTKDEFNAEGNGFGKYMVGYPEIKEGIFTAIEEARANKDNKGKYTAAVVKLTDLANLVVAKRTVKYLGDYVQALRKPFNEEKKEGLTAGNIHEISEGLGFAYSLQYAYNTKEHGKFYLTAEEAKKVTEVDLYAEAKDNSGESTLDNILKKVKEAFNL